MTKDDEITTGELYRGIQRLDKLLEVAAEKVALQGQALVRLEMELKGMRCDVNGLRRKMLWSASGVGTFFGGVIGGLTAWWTK